MKIKKKANAVRIPPLQNAIKVKRKSSEDAEESTVRTALETVKKVIQKKNAKWEVTDSVPVREKNVAPIREHKRRRTLRKPVKRTNGVVYVGHIPHGFYEEEMQGYFKQFGKVTRVRLVRSKNTGKSRGYGYVEFEFPQVARIAAETMNNYLMSGRLLKATYIPPEKLHKGFFIGREWTQKEFPKLRNRNKINRMRNTKLGEKEHASFVQSTVTKLSSLEKELKEKGFNIKFKPVKDTTS